MERDDDLIAMAREVIDSNRYMTLGTTEPDGRPRVSPVYFTHHGYRDFYWVSSPTAQHSVNIAARPTVAIVIFDSSAPVGDGQAVYLSAHAALIGDGELAHHCAQAFSRIDSGAVAFTPQDLSGDARLRLYRAEATTYEVHIRGRDPIYGTGVDTRHEIRVTSALP